MPGWASLSGSWAAAWCRIRLSAGLVPATPITWPGNVSEDEICAEMVTINRGLAESEVVRAAGEFFEHEIAGGIFADMKALVIKLQALECEIWAVSSTSEWVIREAMKHFGIPPERVLAAAVVVEDGKVTDKVIRVPSGKGKPKAIREVIGRTPDAVFGNSIWDADMLEIARHPFAINPTAELEQIARQRQWPIYFPESVARL